MTNKKSSRLSRSISSCFLAVVLAMLSALSSVTAFAADESSSAPAVAGKKKSDTSSSSTSSAAAGKSSSAKSSSSDKAPASTAPAVKSGLLEIEKWKKVNSDVMGYLYIPGTTMDFPIVQNTKSNNYYESRDINKNVVPKYATSVTYADQDVRSKSTNTIIYGHNWTNYSAKPKIDDPKDIMFGQLTSYHYLSYAKDHPYIYYSDAINGDRKWQVFATFYTTDLRFYMKTTGSPVPIADKAKKLSLHNFNVDVKSTDKILTLSTCTRYLGPSSNQRFVVMAKEVPYAAAKAPAKSSSSSKASSSSTKKVASSSSEAAKSWD